MSEDMGQHYNLLAHHHCQKETGSSDTRRQLQLYQQWIHSIIWSTKILLHCSTPPYCQPHLASHKETDLTGQPVKIILQHYSILLAVIIQWYLS
ncbi:hypothetical protein ACROYT_G032701 [Oculina patagonica]